MFPFIDIYLNVVPLTHGLFSICLNIVIIIYHTHPLRRGCGTKVMRRTFSRLYFIVLK